MMQSAITTTCNTVWRYCAINLMIIVLSLAGAVVLGVAPAMSAGYWAMARPETPLDQLAKGMMREWRSEFVRANIFALPLGLAIWGLSLPQIATLMPMPYLMVILVFITEGTIACLYAQSLARASFQDTLANAKMLVLARPFRLLCATLSLPAFILLGIWQPLLALYGLFSLHAAFTVRLLGSMHDPMNRPLAAPTTSMEVQS